MISSLLAHDLIGIYLHGSLAMGCFNPRQSDLDILVVSSTHLSIHIKRQMIEHLLALSLQPCPIEISFLSRDHLLPWRHPTPFDLHFSEAWRAACLSDLASGAWQRWNESERSDPDLAAHVTVISRRGVCLQGEPIASLFPPVPAADYRASLAGDIQESLHSIAANPVYTILNCCRTLAYVREGFVLSKEEGGRWALHVLPAAFRSIVEQALFVYAADTAEMSFDLDTLKLFSELMHRDLLPLLQ